MPRRGFFTLLLTSVAVLLAFVVLAANQEAYARSELGALPQAQASPPPPSNLSISDETCLSCHSNPNLSMPLGNGELLSLFVPPEIHAKSVHGEQGYACVQCHTDVGEYPHPEFKAQDHREVTLRLSESCGRCHGSFQELAHDSVHASAIAEGNTNAATCADCHTAHAVQRVTDPESGQLQPAARQSIPQTCAKCHYAIYQKYSTSVHGADLLEQGNPDVPTCIECHGVHNIEDPTTATFRLNSPQICANCHTDETLMDKYGLSTQVLDTYVADFHGSTVVLFERQHPDQETNKPVCYDCHGIHDIKRVDDPAKGLQVKQNLLARCQTCHPGATENFPEAWLSHYIPTADRNPLVFSINLFYAIFIPAVLGGMGILVFLDAGTLIRKRWFHRRTPSAAAHEGETQREDVQSTTPTHIPQSQANPDQHHPKASDPAQAAETEESDHG